MEEKKAIQEVASESINSLHSVINLMSHQPSHLNSDLINTTISNFKKLSSLLNRTGHARFCRAPLPQPLQTSTPPHQNQLQNPQHQSLTLDCTKLNILRSNPKSLDLEFSKETFNVSSNSSFMSSAITGGGSISNGKQGSSLFLTPPTVSGGKPPLSTRNKCHDNFDDVSGKRSGSNKCHYIKKRKNRVKRTIRVPAISSKIADIPPDEYSWRKYGQKPIKGSLYPRGYYKCSSVRGCPARKHVERVMDDPATLIVTYEGEHRHEIDTNYDA